MVKLLENKVLGLINPWIIADRLNADAETVEVSAAQGGKDGFDSPVSGTTGIDG